MIAQNFIFVALCSGNVAIG